jgi:hypothetical protein
MKNLSISLSLISILLTGQAAHADMSETPSHQKANIETIVVTAMPEVANFEIYSEQHSKKALQRAMNLLALNLISDTVEQQSKPTINSPI